ncbi:MAG: arylsulfatase [Planctomycetota bacterium]|jgi:arylsulfatase/arylsulfatase A
MLIPFITAALLAASPAVPPEPALNVVLVMTDDQGWGDLGVHGNPVVRTPAIDRLAAGSARLDRFYVSPVCTPTRASLVTGRWCQRTTAIDTWIGRAMLGPEEVTVAEILRDAGWATGIFGKWHLGDCYPMRPGEQGFETSLVHRGGGIGQPADPEGGEGRYTDPVLFRDGERVEASGYCTDVYFREAIGWIQRQHDAGRPFFAYIATNAPHGPFHDVPEDEYRHYAAQDLSASRFPQPPGAPLPETADADVLARIFAMIENIDRNVGRLLDAIDRLGVADRTLVLYLHDNGPNTRRYAGRMRGRKGEVYEGGIRSPLLARWPGRLPSGVVTGPIGAHVDVLPTILDACGVPLPAGLVIDGRSLLPALTGAPAPAERTVVIQAHRGDVPVRYHNAAVITPRWKLVSPSGFGREVERIEPAFELYDLPADPFERRDRAAERPEVVARLRAAYDAWFEAVGATDASRYAPPRIHVGASAAPRVVLTRQDWRRAAPRGGWGDMGRWSVLVVDEGPYRVRVRLVPGQTAKRLRLRCGTVVHEATLADGATEHVVPSLRLPPGPAELEVVLEDGERSFGAYQVVITKLER